MDDNGGDRCEWMLLLCSIEGSYAKLFHLPLPLSLSPRLTDLIIRLRGREKKIIEWQYDRVVN